MAKKLRSKIDTDVRLKRAQAIAARKPMKGKRLISEELIKDRRREAERECGMANKGA